MARARLSDNSLDGDEGGVIRRSLWESLTELRWHLAERSEGPLALSTDRSDRAGRSGGLSLSKRCCVPRAKQLGLLSKLSSG